MAHNRDVKLLKNIPSKGNYALEVDGKLFQLFSDVIGYGDDFDFKPKLEWYIVASPDYNPSARQKTAKAKTPRGVVGAVKRLPYKIVKPRLWGG